MQVRDEMAEMKVCEAVHVTKAVKEERREHHNPLLFFCRSGIHYHRLTIWESIIFFFMHPGLSKDLSRYVT